MGSDAVFISTDWEEFRGLSRTIETAVKPPFLIIDGRRMMPDYDALVAKGYDFLPVGGVLRKGANAEAASPNGFVTEEELETQTA